MYFFERIQPLLQSTGKNKSTLEKEIKLTQSSIHNWENSKNKMSIENLIKIATYFNVTTDYLLCLTDIPNVYNLLTENNLNIPNVILNSWHKLNNSQQEMLINMINIFLSNTNNQVPEVHMLAFDKNQLPD